jgi:hypothetical protein
MNHVARSSDTDRLGTPDDRTTPPTLTEPSAPTSTAPAPVPDRVTVDDRAMVSDRAMVADQPTVVARQQERFGGIKAGSAFFGWLTVAGMSVLLIALLAAAGVVVGVATRTTVTVDQAERESEQVTGTAVDTDQHAGLRERFGVNPADLIATFTGGQARGGIGGALGKRLSTG